MELQFKAENVKYLIHFYAIHSKPASVKSVWILMVA